MNTGRVTDSSEDPQLYEPFADVAEARVARMSRTRARRYSASHTVSS